MSWWLRSWSPCCISWLPSRKEETRLEKKHRPDNQVRKARQESPTSAKQTFSSLKFTGSCQVSSQIPQKENIIDIWTVFESNDSKSQIRKKRVKEIWHFASVVLASTTQSASLITSRVKMKKAVADSMIMLFFLIFLVSSCSVFLVVCGDPASSDARSSTRKSHSRSSSSSHASASHSSSSSISSTSSPSQNHSSVTGQGSPATLGANPSSSSSTATSGKMDCTIALGKCTRRMSCGIALHDYRISCKQELYGVSKNCSELCQLSIISLASTPEGYDFIHCDCAQNEYCRLTRQRTEPCNPRKNNRQEVDMCRGAELVCRADTVCNTSYDYYKRHCNDLIKGRTRECSRRCNNTVSLLWRQKAGHSLRNCTCEKGSIKCRRERESVMRSCIGLEGFKAGYTSSSSARRSINIINTFESCMLSLLVWILLLYSFSECPSSSKTSVNPFMRSRV